MLLTRTSPSLAFGEMAKVSVPELEAAVTADVCAEVAGDDPAEFDAVTTTRIVEPTSAEVGA
jgi:hypothetical protein